MSAKSMIGTGVLFTDRRDFYIKPNVFAELWPSVAPFTTILNSKPVMTGIPDPLFKLFEHRNPWVDQYCLINGASEGTVPDDNTGLVSVTVDGIVGMPAMDSSWVGFEFEVWDTTKTTRKGVALVTAQSTPDVTLKLLGGTAFALADNDIMYLIGTAQGEGSSAPEAWADELRTVWGSTQIIEVPVEVTGTLYQAALRGATNELARLRMQKLEEFKMLRERVALFGDNKLGTNLDVASADTFGDTSGTHTRTDAGSRAVRTSMGLLTAIEKYGSSTVTADNQNIFDIIEGSYDYGDFVDDMEKVFRYYPEDGVKYALCGPGAMSYWSKIHASGFAGNSGYKVQIMPKQSSLGFNVRMLETPHGTLALIPTPALRGPRNNYMVAISDSNLQLVQYESAMYKTNIKTDNAYKGVKDTNVVDEGLGMTLVDSHHLFRIK